MSATIIDGKAYAAGLRARIAGAVATLQSSGVVPGLAVVLVGEDPASQVYVRNKARQTVEAGMRSFEHRLAGLRQRGRGAGACRPAQRRSRRSTASLCSCPCPQQVDTQKVIEAIDPGKGRRRVSSRSMPAAS